jgi:hypothetical protein
VKQAPLDSAPTNSRLFVMLTAYAAGRVVSALYTRGFADGRASFGQRDKRDLDALRNGIESARAEMAQIAEIEQQTGRMLPSPGLWQLIGWCEAEVTPGE